MLITYLQVSGVNAVDLHSERQIVSHMAETTHLALRSLAPTLCALLAVLAAVLVVFVY
jgi:hypothetical protein